MRKLFGPKPYVIEVKKAFIRVFMGIAFVGCMAFFVEFLYSETPSWPYSYFLHLKRITPVKGDMGVFWHKGRGQKIIKRVIGTAGDKIVQDSEGMIWVNNQKIGKPFSHGSDGKSLHSIKAQTIPEGYVFMYSPHEKSFDSRYQEVGLIPLKILMGKVIPLKWGLPPTKTGHEK